MKKCIRKGTGILLACIMTLTFLPMLAAFAEEPEIVDSGCCGGEGDGTNLTWTLDSEGTLTVSGTGAMADYSTTYVLMSGLKSDAPWFGYRTNIHAVVVEDGVTYVGKYAFGGMRVFSEFGAYAYIQSVTLPGSVAQIGSRAFYGCSRLQDLTLSEGLTVIGSYAFNSCTALESISVPDSMTEIGESAFGYCTHLTAFAVPAAVTSIGTNAFYSCDSLTAITVDEQNGYYTSDGHGCLYNKSMTVLIRYPSAAPAAAFAVPEGVETVDTQAFQKCVNLKEVSLPASVTEIALPAFEQCSLTAITVDNENPAYSSGSDGCLYNKDKTVLVRYTAGSPETAFTIPDSVTGIAYRAFGKAGNLTALTLSSGLTEIGSGALYGCTGVKLLSIPVSVTKIDDSAIGSCADPLKILYAGTPAQWEDIEIEQSGSTSYLSAADVYYNVVDWGYCGVGSFIVPMPDTMLWIYGSDGTLTVTGSGFMSYEGDAPWNAYKESIQSLTVENTVYTIRDSAFANCTALTDVSLPGSLTGIGMYAFYHTALTSVTIPAGVTSIGKYAFVDCPYLPGFTVDPENTEYSTDDIGCLYNKDKTRLVQYPAGNERSSFTVPDSVTQICDGAFMCCCALKTVTVPDSVTTIGEAAFKASAAETVTLPYSVTEIGANAFEFCASMKRIALPENLTEISDRMFWACDTLESVTIPVSVTSIGNSAFLYCNALRDVFYAGSEEQWNTVTVEDGNDTLLNARIHFIAAGHTPGEHVQENLTPATCVDAGGYDDVVYCTQCGCELSRVYVLDQEPLGHEPGAVVYENVTDPTCTEYGGYDMVVYCIQCYDELSREHVFESPAGHDAGEPEYENVIPATCTEYGGFDEVVYCTRCHDVLSREHFTTAPNGHTPQEAVRENEIAPTCTEAGGYDEVVYCADCGNELSRTHVTVPAAGHQHTVWKEGYDATPTAHGHEAGEYCTDCGNFVTGEVIHNQNGGTYRVQDATWLDEEEYLAACRDGDYIIYCSVCGEYGLYKEEIQGDGTNTGNPFTWMRDKFKEMMAGWIEVFLRLIRWFNTLN